MKSSEPGENTWENVPECKGFERSSSSVHSRKRKEFGVLLLSSSHPRVKASCSYWVTGLEPCPEVPPAKARSSDYEGPLIPLQVMGCRGVCGFRTISVAAMWAVTQ